MIMSTLGFRDLLGAVKKFLNIRPSSTLVFHCCLQLALRKNELNSLYEEVKKTRCLADDCSRSVVHQLLSKLVKLTTSSDSNACILFYIVLKECQTSDVYLS